MEDLVDLIATDASSSDISDKIAKAAEYVDATRPIVGAELFGDEAPQAESEVEVEDETTIEPEET